jgi:hypothetical protein
MGHDVPSLRGRGRETTPIGLEEGPSFYLQDPWKLTAPEVPFDYMRGMAMAQG